LNDNASSMKIDPATLAFDIDGVVADTMTLFLQIANQDFGVAGTYEDITEYDLRLCLGIEDVVLWEIISRILHGNYSVPLNPIDGAPRVIRRINRRSQPTRFVTARPDGAHIEKWLCDTLAIPADVIDVVATGSFEDKQVILAEKNVKYFVEDRLETCFLLADAGIQPIVFKQPWNRKPHPFPEVANWQELETMILFE